MEISKGDMQVRGTSGQREIRSRKDRRLLLRKDFVSFCERIGVAGKFRVIEGYAEDFAGGGNIGCKIPRRDCELVQGRCFKVALQIHDYRWFIRERGREITQYSKESIPRCKFRLFGLTERRYTS